MLSLRKPRGHIGPRKAARAVDRSTCSNLRLSTRESHLHRWYLVCQIDVDIAG